MQNRRNFLKQTSILAAAGVLANPLSNLAELAKHRKAGVQLFTLFPGLDQDVRGNLQTQSKA